MNNPLFKTEIGGKNTFYFIDNKNKVREIFLVKFLGFNEEFKQFQYEIELDHKIIRVCESALYLNKRDAARKTY